MLRLLLMSRQELMAYARTALWDELFVRSELGWFIAIFLVILSLTWFLVTLYTAVKAVQWLWTLLRMTVLNWTFLVLFVVAVNLSVVYLFLSEETHHHSGGPALDKLIRKFFY